MLSQEKKKNTGTIMLVYIGWRNFKTCPKHTWTDNWYYNTIPKFQEFMRKGYLSVRELSNNVSL